ncbi:hypothetical protein JTE90_007617 [Oedothorax gibbosus]|uniref:Sushi domain-containing protein n=1 Tax=Oedothorax gibbosus TaxID=931172 RepID=A0AAV6U5I7_9ARAC|nr:hypothetical protein JTE90_007617 [Oedothorax gibbosus]
MATVLLFVASLWSIAASLTVEVPECEPPDAPQFGGYGPRQDYYLAGDVIHYYCDTDFHIGGNFYRRCEDTGDWIGNTPVCDEPQNFSSVNQTSTADPEDQNGADRAVDGMRGTCSHTKGGKGVEWIAMLEKPGQLFRVMTFLPKVDVAYEVFMIRRNGQELSCGSKVGTIDYLNWEFHNCPGPNNIDIVGVKIKSLSDMPLRLCEVVAHVLTSPTCDDPHVRIDNGRLLLTRKSATLVCDTGYTRSSDARLDCVRTGVWNRKSLYCLERQWETGNTGIESNHNP